MINGTFVLFGQLTAMVLVYAPFRKMENIRIFVHKNFLFVLIYQVFGTKIATTSGIGKIL